METQPSTYQILQKNTELEKRVLGVNPQTSMENIELRYNRIPIEVVERTYIQNCDTLAGMMDGTIVESEHFIDGKPRYDGPVTHAISLDKSMRPAWMLMRKVWSELSSDRMPGVSYRNIDKERWKQLMLPETENIQAPDVTRISLENAALHELKDGNLSLREHLARIRATYLSREDLEKLDESNMEDVFNYPTILDGKHVAIVDEVKSSGATLKVADLLLQAAVPEAKFEPMYWSVPGVVKWSRLDESNGAVTTEFAARTVPVWYDSETSEGRIIRDLDPIEALDSQVKKHRVGAYVLSRPYVGGIDMMDKRSIAIRDDLRILAERFKEHKVEYIPSGDRSDDDLHRRIEAYYHIPFAQWLNARRKQAA